MRFIFSLWSAAVPAADAAASRRRRERDALGSAGEDAGVPLLLLLLLFCACATAPTPAPKPLTIEEMRQTIVDLETTKGVISLELFPDQAPNHVRNFIELARSGFYDGTNFHRVIPGFMIQGGDPNTRNASRADWGTGSSGKTLDAEFNKIPHERGILSMARAAAPNSASSQFFICVAPARFLDEQYTVFGRVTSGMKVADVIVNGKRNQMDQPDEPVVITRARVRSK